MFGFFTRSSSSGQPVSKGAVTVVVESAKGGVPLFGRREVADCLLGSVRELIEKKKIVLRAWLLMPNELHLVVAKSKESLEALQVWRSTIAPQLIESLMRSGDKSLIGLLGSCRHSQLADEAGQVWEAPSAPQALSKTKAIAERIAHIHRIPVEHGYVEHPGHWRYSSAHDTGTGRLLEVTR